MRRPRRSRSPAHSSSAEPWKPKTVCQRTQNSGAALESHPAHCFLGGDCGRQRHCNFRAKGIAGALKAHWSHTFTASHDCFPAADADRFLGEWSLKWRLEDSTPPCLDDIARCAKKAKKSAPGPDGLPYAAWREGGIEASKTLLGLTRDASSGLCHSGLNDQSLVFLPKDVPGGSDDSSGPAREPSDTRPLSLKNTDVKICTSAVNGRIKKKVKSVAHKDQRGFISGRQLLSNILLIDS